jgi:hypothetical protein
MIFTSRDDLHRKMAPLFIGDDQVFLDGDELKADLASILESADTEELPHISTLAQDSTTARLWKKLGFELPRQSVVDEMTEAQKREIVERLIRMNEGAIPSPNPFEGDEIEFIQRRTYVTPDDLCPCGSGKQFRDCHLPEVNKSRP